MGAEKTWSPSGRLSRSGRSGLLGCGEVKRILRIACGMIGRSIKGVEAVVFIFDFRAICDDEADFSETSDDLLGHLGEGVKPAERPAATGKGEIGRLFGLGGFEFEFTSALGQSGFDLRFCSINGFAGGRFLLLRQAPELLHQTGQFAVGAEMCDTGLLERGEVGGGAQIGERCLFQRFDFIQQACHSR